MTDFPSISHGELPEHELTAALERKPAVRVPEDFAARMAAQAATMPAGRPRRVISYARAFTLASAALLLLAMFLLAPWTQPNFSSVAFDVELAMLVQLVVLGGWIAARPQP